MQRFKNILYVVAPDSDNKTAMERAATLAHSNQASFTVVEVIDEISSKAKLLSRDLSPENLQAKIVAEHQQGLEDLVAPWRRKIEIQTKILAGVPFLEIIHEVLRENFDLVIKTAENGGLLDRVFGSDDMHLLRKCPCPVWLVKPKSTKAYQRILAAVDVGDYYLPKDLNTRHQLNDQILEMAISLAVSETADLHIAYVWEAIAEDKLRGSAGRPEEEVTDYVAAVKHQHERQLTLLVEEATKSGIDFEAQTHLPKGSPRQEIPALADKIEADLVVMGTVARTGIPGFVMGNTAETILNKIDCSVLAIKPSGFVTPVTLVI